MLKRIYLFGFILALLASCQVGREDLSIESEDQPVRFNLSIAGAITTRASNKVWAKDDKVGIYMVPYLKNVADVADFSTYAAAWNKEYVTTEQGINSGLNAVSDFLRYPANGDKVSFLAYYPYRADLVSSNNVYPVNVAKQDPLAAVDLLYSDTKSGVQYQKGQEVTLAFKHQLSKLIVTLSKESASGAADLSGPGLSANGIPTTAEFDLSTGTLTKPGGAATAIAPVPVYTKPDSVAWEAIVVPHKAADFTDRELMVSLGGKQYSVILPGNVDFDAGYVYTFRCKFISYQVTLTDRNTIQDWTKYSPDNLEGDIEEISPLTPTPQSATQVEDGMTNCYMVTPGDEVAFPVSRAYVYDTDQSKFTDALHVGGDYTDEFGAEIVWQTEKVIRTISVDGKGNAAVVSVYVHNTSGNAVVKIYKKGDNTKTPVWSYHIWVTPYDPAAKTWDPLTAGGNTTQKVAFMDRNLGALEAANSLKGRGLHYQWGRKDPLPLKDGIIAVVTGPINNVVTTILNPVTFYTANGASYDWLNPKTDSLWDNAGKKTIYDPCPAGFKVPLSGADKLSPWSGLAMLSYVDGDEAGYKWGDSYWPAAGAHIRNNGKLASEGKYAYYWSATATNNDVYALHFYNNKIFLNSTNTRADAFSVRCVKE